MVENRYKITVNTKEKMVRLIPEIVANDNVVFEIGIFDGATSFTLSSGYSYKLVSLKPSGKSVIRDGVLSGNAILFTLGSSETLEAGKIEATVQVFDADMKRISTANFSYKVKIDPSLQGELPTDDKTLVIANESLLNDTIAKAEEQKKRVDELIKGNPQPSEIVDSRGGFPVLRDRLDKFTSDLADIAVNVKTLGAIGDGVSHPLSEKFPTLALAQMKYPHATALTDEIDWCAVQLAINNSRSVLAPEGTYILNKTINILSSHQFKGASREKTVFQQNTDNIPIVHVEGWFHDIGNFSAKYRVQQTRDLIGAVGIELNQLSQSNFESISLFNVNKGIAPKNLNSWNYTMKNIYVEGFSLTGINIPKASGVTYENIYVCKPYLTAYSGVEIERSDYVVINQLNIEGWYDANDPNYGSGLIEKPLLVKEARVVINGLSFEAVTLVGDNGFIVTEGLDTETSNIIVNQTEMYNNALSSTYSTRGAFLHTKHPTFAQINGLKNTVLRKQVYVAGNSDINNSLLITTTNQTRAEFKGVTGGIIVGTNDYNGSYGSAGQASTYTYVTNDDNNLGVALQKVNDTVYSQKFKKDITAQFMTLTNGGVKFPPVQVASTDPNTLDDYIEGTWTPNVLFGGLATGITYIKQDGTLTKVGRVVCLNATVQLSAKGTATGTMLMNGLPYFSVKKSAITVAMRNVTGITGYVQGMTRDTTSKNMDFEVVTSTGAAVITDAQITNTTEIILSGSYQI